MQKLQLKGAFMIFRFNIQFMQRKMRKQIAVMYSKADVLLNYWDKIIGNLLKSKGKTEKDMALIAKLSSVPLKIKISVLHEWVDRCRALYSIAFM